MVCYKKIRMTWQMLISSFFAFSLIISCNDTNETQSRPLFKALGAEQTNINFHVHML